MPQPALPAPFNSDDIFSTVREPLLVLDGEFRVERANRAFYRTFRVTPVATEGRRIYDLGNGQWNMPALRRLLEEVLATNSAFDDFEIEHDFEGIGRKVMLLNARLLHRASGESDQILLAMEDITERRRLEAERQQLETSFTSLVQNIRDHSIFTLTPDGLITSWNREAERILGYSEAEALGQHFSLIFTPEDREAGVPEQELRTALLEGRADDERWHVRKGGDRLWALGIVTPTCDSQGLHTGYSKILRDMTDRRRTEVELRQAHRILDSMLTAAPVGLAYLDRELRFVRVNPWLAQLNGLPPHEHVGKHVRDVVPSLAATAERVAARILSTGEDVQNVEFWGDLPAEPGHMRCWSESWYPVRGPEGEIAGFGVVVEETTKRKQAEAALRESESFYRQTLESVPGMSFTTRPDGYCDFQSQQWAAFTGIPVEQHLGDGWLNLLHPEDRSRAFAAWRAAVEGRGIYDLEYRIRRADGAYEWFKVSARAIRDDEGEVVRWFGSAVSVDALKQAEEQLRQAEQRQAFLLRLSDSLRSLTDSKQIRTVGMQLLGEFCCVDRATYFEVEDDRWATNPCGYAVDGVEMPARLLLSDFGQPWLEAYAESRTLATSDIETDPRFSESDRRAWRELGFCGGVGVPLNKQGRLEALVGLNVRAPRNWIEQELELVEEAGRRIWLAVERADAEAERETARRELAAQSRFLDAIMSSIPDLVYAFDRSGRFVYANPAMRVLFGPDIDLLGKNFEDLGYPTELAHKLNEDLRHVVSTGESVQDEVFYRAPTGVAAFFQYVWGAVRAEDGTVEMVVGVSRDTTQRHRLEAQLREADQRKTQFLAMLGHELRNPLAPIRNAVALLRLRGPKVPELDEAREVIDRQANHLARLVDDLLDVSRVSCGKVQVRRQPMDLREAVQQAVEACQPLIDDRLHTLQVVLPEECVWVQGDPTRLTQVFSNLLNNACKYTDPRGRIEVHLQRADQQAEVRVRDNGRGIEPAVLTNLFDVFYQSDRNIDRSEGGLGLGLALVKSLVELHGGSVEALSTGRGQGSEFIVRLPLCPVNGLSEPARPQQHAPDGIPPLKILVVDDNRDAARTLATLLRLGGHSVETAHDGLEAVELAIKHRPEVVLLDIGLPHLDGYAACRRMRSAGLRDTKIFALTGYGQPEDRQQSQAAGCDAHLVKPLDMGELRRLLAASARES
jgi:PAS domain S-box-containing protein